jgi:hypothetical protein
MRVAGEGRIGIGFERADASAFPQEAGRGGALVKADDVRKLKAFEINPVSSSPKAIDRYRNLAVIALAAKAAP